MISAISKLHSKAIADELDEILSAGWIAASTLPTALENPILKKALEQVARKARTTHVHTTVASFSHARAHTQLHSGEHTCVHMHEGSLCVVPLAVWHGDCPWPVRCHFDSQCGGRGAWVPPASENTRLVPRAA
jgi:hypothetical protein